MKTARISRTTTISLPPKLYKEAVRLAHDRGMTQSELFREAFRRFRREELEWKALQIYGGRKAHESGIRTEADVERLIDAGRK